MIRTLFIAAAVLGLVGCDAAQEPCTPHQVSCFNGNVVVCNDNGTESMQACQNGCHYVAKINPITQTVYVEPECI